MTPPARKAPKIEPREGDWTPKNLALLLGMTVAAFLVMGYHPGLEDDAFYLAAIKRNLNPALFPHDADFFLIQFQATIFDKLIAYSVRLTHLPLAWVVLLWQLAGIFFILHACWRIGRRCFADSAAQWAAVAMVAALLTLPVTGTGINLADQYLHPRTLATAAILAAVVGVLDRRPWRAGVLLVVAFLIHAIMASFGISLCAFLIWKQRRYDIHSSTQIEVSNARASLAAFAPFCIPLGLIIPLGWVFEPASEAWRQAAATRSFYFLSHWEWYEWLGVFAPLVLLYIFQGWQRAKALGDKTSREKASRENANLLLLVSALIGYYILQTIVGLIVMLVPGLIRLRPFEPMRYLHLIYLFFFLIAGALLGRYVLERKIYRWLLLFVPLGAAMFYAQREMYPSTEHLEWPDANSRNAWLEAFGWIRENTPVDAVFAIGPRYMTQPGEDYHGFRAIAERSVLADYDKDGGMAARVPSLAPRWVREVDAQNGWKNFQAADFQRLHKDFGVTWVILARSYGFGAKEPDSSSGLMCLYENRLVRVCRLY
jgi:hypothetical protein